VEGVTSVPLEVPDPNLIIASSVNGPGQSLFLSA
jgi:hypothetical protein